MERSMEWVKEFDLEYTFRRT